MADGFQQIHPLVVLACVIIVVICLEVIHSSHFLDVILPPDYKGGSSVRRLAADSVLMRSFPSNSSDRRYIVVDCGANRGDVARFVGAQLATIAPGSHWTYSFEPNLHYEPFLRNLEHHTYVPKACWIDHGNHEYYVAKCARGAHKAGSLLKEKMHSCKHRNKTKMVPTVDIGQWLIEHVNVTDFLLFRLNVEGAEYQVVDRLHKLGALKLVDRIAVEYHSRWMSNKNHNDDHRVNEILAQYGLSVQAFLTSDEMELAEALDDT
mmetsp:Transcript_136863/g.237796  ORF Transcript_136863/g.237796 Transcript_136863/m.237796 type:complete len:264 (-) Transcript_136863:134-925(-)